MTPSGQHAGRGFHPHGRPAVPLVEVTPCPEHCMNSRRNGTKFGEFLGKCNGEAETAEQTGRGIYSHTQITGENAPGA